MLGLGIVVPTLEWWKGQLSMDNSCIDRNSENICSNNMKPFLQLLVMGRNKMHYEKLPYNPLTFIMYPKLTSKPIRFITILVLKIVILIMRYKYNSTVV